jgi:hypothetical protein
LSHGSCGGHVGNPSLYLASTRASLWTHPRTDASYGSIVHPPSIALESRGTDCRIICVGGKAIYSMIRRAAPGAFRANLAQGGHGEIVTGQYPEAERLAERISHILKIDICGVDLLFSGSGFVVCEVNNNPGFSKVRVRVPCRAVLCVCILL